MGSSPISRSIVLAASIKDFFRLRLDRDQAQVNFMASIWTRPRRVSRFSGRFQNLQVFVVDKKYRKRGVGSTALKAALEAIRHKGGGLVEAYAITRWQAGTFGNVSTHGTVSMFEKERFKVVPPFGRTKFQTNVLMRRTI